MPRNRAKPLILLLLWLTCAAALLGLKAPAESIGLVHTISLFKEGAGEFVQASAALQTAISGIDARQPLTVKAARQALRNSRRTYKKISFFLDYFFESESLIYNRPAKVEVEEPYIEYQEPSGFQVMEAILYNPEVGKHKAELAAQADLLYTSAADLKSLLYGFKGNDRGVMESLRLEMLRVITLGITGYDAPELKSGISEAYVSVTAISNVLQPYLLAASQPTGTLITDLKQTREYLKDNQDFDHFDRMYFLTRYALPLQEHLDDFIRREKLGQNTQSALNYNAKNIFSGDALSVASINPAVPVNKAAIALGEKLFREQALSGNLRRSCQSCHRPGQSFTDGLKTSLALDGKSSVQRNAPALFYAGFQYAQFWDGRVSSLQEQVGQVMANPLEMNADHLVVLANLKKIPAYQKDFKTAFPEKRGEVVTMENLSDALAAYIAQLNPRNSAFDSYMNGNKKAMTAAQVKGFNLFMGKAQCGSCHFAPLFNGLIPPFYKRTEFEIIGTPGNDDFDHAQPDTDKGRADFFPIVYYQGAFKTPTVRNVGNTAPYMHNGVFKDLKKVVQFYNLGGGTGLHLDVPQQTLLGKPLHLTDREVEQIVVFMQSLSDH